MSSLLKKIVAIIPARGGSKGIQSKNIKHLAGKPLIAWTIEAAVRSQLVSEVFVSTDNEIIAGIASDYGAKILNRPIELSGDQASSESALLHALGVLDQLGEQPDILVFMQCTSPLTSHSDIDSAIDKLIRTGADSCFTATDFHYFVWQQNEDGSMKGINHDQRYRARRQDRDKQFVENGAIYVMRTEGFRKAQHRFFGKTIMSMMPAERCVEIDELLDLSVAEVLLKNKSDLRGKTSSSGLYFEKFRNKSPRAVVFDFDGVFTDNKVYVDETGRESVCCDRSDGWGLDQLKGLDIKLVVLSSETNPVVSARCNKFGIECCQGLGAKKFEAFQNWCVENEIEPQDVIFVGNDANDVECLRSAGCGVAPSDAYPEAKDVANIVLSRSGGAGAIRELCDILLKESTSLMSGENLNNDN